VLQPSPLLERTNPMADALADIYAHLLAKSQVRQQAEHYASQLDAGREIPQSTSIDLAEIRRQEGEPDGQPA
jgi:predicted DNA-binding protein YlxM (UPF0122 family)